MFADLGATPARARAAVAGSSRTEPPPAFALFLLLTIVAGTVLATPVVMGADWSAVSEPRLWILAAFVVLGELFPIRVPGGKEDDHVTLSTPFAFAVLLSYGPG